MNALLLILSEAASAAEASGQASDTIVINLWDLITCVLGLAALILCIINADHRD